MAEIELRILAADALDLRETLRELADVYDERERVEMGEVDPRDEAFDNPHHGHDAEEAAEQPQAAATEDAEAAPPKQRKAPGRPRKNAAGATETVSTGAAALGVGDPFSTQIQDIVREEEALAAAPVKPQPQAHVNPSLKTAIEKDDVRAAMYEYSKRDGNSMVKLQQTILMKFQDTEGAPVKQISNLQPKDYPAVMEMLKA